MTALSIIFSRPTPYDSTGNWYWNKYSDFPDGWKRRKSSRKRHYKKWSVSWHIQFSYLHFFGLLLLKHYYAVSCTKAGDCRRCIGYDHRTMDRHVYHFAFRTSHLQHHRNILFARLFAEDAVTVLGIYYKLQTFFFIPLMGLQQVIFPVISFNYGAKKNRRVKETLRYSLLFSCFAMALGTFIFMLMPTKLIAIFSSSSSILHIGARALRTISISFIPAGFALMFTVYFQGINKGKCSIFLTILRQIVLPFFTAL